MASGIRRLVGVCQMTSTHDLDENFRTCERLISKAVDMKATMVFLPECFDFVGRSKKETLAGAHAEDGEFISRFRRLAKELRVWLSLGGFHEKSESEKPYNSHIVLGENGETIAKYRKLHLFDVDIPGARVMESDFSQPGDRLPRPFQTPLGKLGLATCYDLRFPEMSSYLRGRGAELLSFPSAFTMRTGMAHWDVLLRSRAVENQCWVVAAAQTGDHNPSRVTYGHACVVDPWGEVVARCGEGEGVCVAEIDLDYLARVRQKLPCSLHRRTDLYNVVGSCPPDPIGNEDYNFGGFNISASSVFYKTELSFAFVNLKPVVDGHVLIAPIKNREKFEDLELEEITDLFSVAQKVQKALAAYYNTDSTTLTIQDGKDAGQTVQHVHIHILPRKPGDFQDNDKIYKDLATHDIDSTRRSRTTQEMAEEAEIFRTLFK